MIPWREKARLRPRELAEIASVSLSTIKRKIDSGELESFTQDGMRFVPIHAALRFLGEAESQPSPTTSVRVSPEARAFVERLRQRAC